MSDFTQGGGVTRFATYGVNTSTSLGTLVTASGSANTKGSYAELTASTDFDAQGILVCFNRTEPTDRYYVDIAVGAAGSEVVIIPNVLLREEDTRGLQLKMFFPITIPAGTRLSARCQTDTAGGTVYVSGTICGGNGSNFPICSGVEAIGLKADTDGTYFHTNGLSVNTKCAWQEMVASTTHDIKAIDIGFSHFWTSANSYHLFDIGIGAAGSEQVLIPNVADCSNAAVRSVNLNNSGIIPCSIPAGSRVSYRGQSDGSGNVRYFVLLIHGFY